MGLFGGSSGNASGGVTSALPPAPGPIGVLPQYCQHQTEVVFRITENRFSFTGDSFRVKDTAGRDVFEVSAKAMSLHDRKQFRDAAGQPLFDLTKRIVAIHATYDAESPSGTKLFKIQKHLSLGKAKISCKFDNLAADGRPIELDLRGDFFDRKAEICMNGVPVARIARSFANARELFLYATGRVSWLMGHSDKQTYMLSVAPGVDCSLLVALAIILDETENEPSK